MRSVCYNGTVIETKEGRAAFVVKHDDVIAARLSNTGQSLAGVHRSAVRLYLSDTGQARLA